MLKPEPRRDEGLPQIAPVLVEAAESIDQRRRDTLDDPVYVLNRVFESALRGFLETDKGSAKAKELLFSGAKLLCRLPDTLADHVFDRLEEPGNSNLLARLVHTLPHSDPLLDVMLNLVGRRILHIMDPRTTVAAGRYPIFMYDRQMPEIALQSDDPRQAFEAVVPGGILNYRESDLLVKRALSFVKSLLAAGANPDWTTEDSSRKLDSFRKLLDKAVIQVSVILGEGTSDIAKILEEAPRAPIDPSNLEATHSSRDVSELSALDAIYALGGFTAFSFNNEGTLFYPSGKEVNLPDKFGLTLRSGGLFERGLTDFWREARPALSRARTLLLDFITRQPQSTSQ